MPNGHGSPERHSHRKSYASWRGLVRRCFRQRFFNGEWKKGMLHKKWASGPRSCGILCHLANGGLKSTVIGDAPWIPMIVDPPAFLYDRCRMEFNYISLS
jgi:hypothetical protein